VSDATTPRSAGFDAGPSTLFPLPSDLIAVTSDDCYTPRWVFDAMGLEFDLDVAAPPGGPWHVPAKRYYTAEDDGLVQPWNGVVWCNPPYSGFRPWAERFAQHDRACLMGLMLNSVKWLGPALRSSDAIALLPGIRFHTPPEMVTPSFRQVVFVAFRGVGIEPAERLAAADPYGAVLYGRSAA
jgi:hypothetical protein